MQCTTSIRPVVLSSFEEICDRLGPPVLLDAARVGSYTFRLRNYWTNLCNPAHLQLVLDSYERDPSLALSDILEQGRSPQVCSRLQPTPWYPANVVGEPLMVLPTLVATVDSYSFRNGKSGMVLSHDDQTLVPLTIEERELALGFTAGCTAAPQMSYEARHRATGSCFDINSLSTLLAAAFAIRARNDVPMHSLHSYPSWDEEELHDSGYPAPGPQLIGPNMAHPHLAGLLQSGQWFLRLASLSAIATGEDSSDPVATSPADVWDDLEVMSYLRGEQKLPISRRTLKRSQRFRWTGDTLFRCMADGTLREVPPPAGRYDLIRTLHESTGHWGRRRTTHMVLQTYWFSNLYQAVRDVVRSCSACSRQQATFNSLQPVLNSVPIRGYMYRWGVDLAGPFTTSDRGNTYFMVCIEHFSKYIEVFPINGKCSKEVAYHFLNGVIARYGACAEVITDGGGEFQGEFADLLVKTLIDHRVSSATHPQSNGLSERCVKSIKACVQRYVDTAGFPTRWDEYLPWILMGYRCTPQESSKVSPYLVLFGCEPVIPPSIVERMSEPLDFDDPDIAAASITQRAKACEEACIIVGRNLLVAQHRDQLRYARLRSGGYLPQLVNFFVGQFVYVKDSGDALHRTARSVILRVVDVRPSGVLVLIGSDGHTTTENAINVAPCHLPIHMSTASPLPDRPRPNHFCEICQLINDEHVMLLCDYSCNRGWHTYCLSPPLASVPQGDWLCKDCIAAGVDLATLRTQRASFQQIRDTRQAQRYGRLRHTPSTAQQQGKPPALWPHGRPDPSQARRFVSLKALLKAKPGGPAPPISQHAMVDHPSIDTMTIDALQSNVSSTELIVLLRSVDLSQSPSIISFTSGHDTPLPALVMKSQPHHSLVGQHAISYPCDLRITRTLRRLRSRHGCHILIASPCLSSADHIIPQVTSYARHMACFKVPFDFVNKAPASRSSWFSSLFHAGRLDILPIPVEITPEPHVWLRVFPSPPAQVLLLKGNAWDREIRAISSHFQEL